MNYKTMKEIGNHKTDILNFLGCCSLDGNSGKYNAIRYDVLHCNTIHNNFTALHLIYIIQYLQ